MPEATWIFDKSSYYNFENVNLCNQIYWGMSLSNFLKMAKIQEIHVTCRKRRIIWDYCLDYGNSAQLLFKECVSAWCFCSETTVLIFFRYLYNSQVDPLLLEKRYEERTPLLSSVCKRRRIYVNLSRKNKKFPSNAIK